MRVILDGFDGSFLPILQSFKTVMPSLQITGIEEIGQSVKDAPGEENEGNADAINVSELFARQYERDELLPDGSLFLQDDKFDARGEDAAVKFDENVKFENARQAINGAEFEPNLAAKSERKTAFAQEQILQDRPLAMPYQDSSREKETILQTGSLSKAPKTAVLAGGAQTTAKQEASVFGGATQTAPFGKAATSNDAVKVAVSDDFAQAALFDFNEPGQNLTPRAETKAALERKKHESASLFTDEEVRAILELK
ncbi:MAG: hypothetical protein ACFNTA_00685 [Campylobacter sp.]|uniref:hypothetical protein n=1 Tax=Campylobacter sp. TaxID=205 RepID=UPI003614A752